MGIAVGILTKNLGDSIVKEIGEFENG